RAGNVWQPKSVRRHFAKHVSRRQDRLVRHHARQRRDRLEHGRFQRAHNQRRLRPRDVRNLVQNDGYDPERARHLASDHTSLSIYGIQGSHRADEIRQLRQNRTGLECLAEKARIATNTDEVKMTDQPIMYDDAPTYRPPYGSPIEDVFAYSATKYLRKEVRLVPQQKIRTYCGSFRVDFLIQFGKRRVAVECD